MRDFGLKICLFLFLAALFSGRTNELGTITGSATGTILLWPLYRKLVPAPIRPRRKVVIEDSAEPVAE